jgi:excisionase family DNA binding protein
MTSVDQRRLLTIREVMARLDQSEAAVRRHIRAGRLPGVQLGGPGSAIRVDERDLDEFVYGPPEAA